MNKLLIALGLLAFANAAYMRLDNTGSFDKVSGELYLTADESADALDGPDYASDEFGYSQDDLSSEFGDEVEGAEEGEEEGGDEEEEGKRESIHDFGFKWGQVCKQCHPGCFPWMRGNKKCDAVCNFPKCKYDDGDCKPTPGAKYCYFDKKHPKKSCLWSKIGNGKCDWECFRPECNYDGGDCYNQDCDYSTFDKKTHCAPGCLWRMVGNDICDWQCLTKHCYFDYKDCCPDGKCDHHGH